MKALKIELKHFIKLFLIFQLSSISVVTTCTNTTNSSQSDKGTKNKEHQRSSEEEDEASNGPEVFEEKVDQFETSSDKVTLDLPPPPPKLPQNKNDHAAEIEVCDEEPSSVVEENSTAV